MLLLHLSANNLLYYIILYYIRRQGVLIGDDQVAVSELFGGGQIHSTHGVHPKAPNQHVFRLSNDRQHGILGVGPQWHNDGSFVRAVFSHVGYHIIHVPQNGGATEFCHLGAAYDSLTAEEQASWSRRVSVNSNGPLCSLSVVTHCHSLPRSHSYCRFSFSLWLTHLLWLTHPLWHTQSLWLTHPLTTD